MFKCIRHLLLIFGLVGVCTYLSGQSGFLNLDIDITHPSNCEVKDGSIDIDVLNGMAPFLYSIDGGATYSNGSVFQNLSIGSYVVFVKDAKEEFSSFKFIQLVALYSPIIDGVVFENPKSCREGGSIIIEASGGIGALEYSIDGGQTFQTNSIFTNVPQGTYDVVVRNNNLTCLATYPTISYTPIEPVESITAEVQTQKPTCGANDGTIQILVNGNLADYEFSIDRGNTFQQSNYFNQLPHGNYSVLVRDIQTKCQKEVGIIQFDPAGCPTPPVNCPTLIQDQIIELGNCNDQISYCLNIPYHSISDYHVNVDGVAFTQELITCHEDNNLAALLFNKGRYLVHLIHRSTNCESIAFLTVTCGDPTEVSCNYIESQNLEIFGEPENRKFCLGIPFNSLHKYEVFQNGSRVIPTITCREDSTMAALSLSNGTHQISINEIGICSDDASVAVTNNFDPTDPTFCGNLIEDETMIEIVSPTDKRTICLNIPIVCFEGYNVLINGVPPGEDVLACSDNTHLLGLLLGIGTHHITINHDNGTCSDEGTIRIAPIYDPTNPDYCNNLIENENLTLNNVDEITTYCLNIPLNRVNEFEVRVNGIATTNLIFCSEDVSLAALALERGLNRIEINHRNGLCSDMASIRLTAPYEPTDPTFCNTLIQDAIIDLEKPTDQHYYCLNIPIPDLHDWTINVDGRPVTQTILACREDTTQAGILFDIGSYEVSIAHNNGICKDSASVKITGPPNPEDPAFCKAIIENQTITLDQVGGSIPVCLNIPFQGRNDYTIQVNGHAPTQPMVACGNNTALNFNEGLYFIKVSHENGTCVDSATVSINDPFDPIDSIACTQLINNTSLEVASPTDQGLFCLNISNAEASNFTITVNGVNSNLAICTAESNKVGVYLPVGMHLVKLEHFNGICKDEAMVTVTATSGFDSTDSLSCNNLIGDSVFDVATGETYPYCLNIPLTEISNFSVTDNGVLIAGPFSACATDPANAQVNLSEGEHVIELKHNNGLCNDRATVTIRNSFSTDDPVACMALIENGAYELIDSGETFLFCLNIPSTEIAKFTITIRKNGQSVSPMMTTCAQNSQLTALALSQGIYSVSLEHDNKICIDSATIRIDNPMDKPLECSDFLKDNDIFDVTDCDTLNTYCMGIPADQATNFSLTVDGISTDFVPCADPSELGIPLSVGVHELVLCSDTITMTVRCLPPTISTFMDTLKFNSRDTFCMDTGLLAGTIDTIYNGCPEKGGDIIDFSIDTTTLCIAYSSNSRDGLGEACIVICNEAGDCGTVNIGITVLPEPMVSFMDSLRLNQTDTFCVDTTLLDGTITSISNVCPELLGDAVTFSIDTSTYCVTYTAQKKGTSQACIRICDDTGNCATTQMSITAFEHKVNFMDSLALNTTDTFCIDTTQLPGTIISIMNTCPDLSGEAVVFTIDTSTYCVSYTAMEMGSGTACIQVCDDLGNCFTTEFNIIAFDPRLAFDTTILVGVIDTFCIDTSFVTGAITSIKNVCLTRADTVVTFTIDTLTKCIAYEGKVVGTGKACIEVCSATQCDTVNLTIRVIEDSIKAPIAVIDRDTTNAGEDIVLNVLGNDSLFTADSIEVTIVAMPPNGEAIVNPDGTITYTPNDNFCDSTDLFMYQVCNLVGCDTARVLIYIDCTMLEPLGGFSPNGDGVNDNFIINGIAGFPGNRLQIFDRRGTRVFNSSPYNNDWNGIWEGKDLPDGIYFYLLDDGKGNRQSGYIVLRR